MKVRLLFFILFMASAFQNAYAQYETKEELIDEIKEAVLKIDTSALREMQKYASHILPEIDTSRYEAMSPEEKKTNIKIDKMASEGTMQFVMFVMIGSKVQWFGLTEILKKSKAQVEELNNNATKYKRFLVSHQLEHEEHKWFQYEIFQDDQLWYFWGVIYGIQ